MNKKDQKQILEAMLNRPKYSEEKDLVDFSSIFSEVSKKLRKDGDSIDLESFLSSDNSLNIDTVMDTLLDSGIEPIDFVEFLCHKMSDMQSFSHMGSTVDLTQAKDLFDITKKQFEEHKKSEDINDF